MRGYTSKESLNALHLIDGVHHRHKLQLLQTWKLAASEIPGNQPVGYVGGGNMKYTKTGKYPGWMAIIRTCYYSPLAWAVVDVELKTFQGMELPNV
jgi:hypothetical protein